MARKVAIIGSGSIGTDLMMKILKPSQKVMFTTAAWVALVLAGDAIIRGSALQGATSLLFGAVAGLGAWLLHYVSRGKFGFGDVKLVAILSTALAFIHPTLVMAGLLAACLIAIAIGLLTRRAELPFGPSLAAGSIIAMVLVTPV